MGALVECHLEGYVVIYGIFQVYLRQHVLEKLPMPFYLAILPVCLRARSLALDPKALGKFLKRFTVHFSPRVECQFSWWSGPANPVLIDYVDEIRGSL